MTLTCTGSKGKKRSRSSLAASPSRSPASGVFTTQNDVILSSRSHHQTSLFSFFSKAPKIRKATPSPKNKSSGDDAPWLSKSSTTTTTASCGPFTTPSTKTTSNIANHAAARNAHETHVIHQMPSPRHSKTTKPLTQVYLDCGQKQFGQLLCDRCGMLYMPGVAEDERHHRPLCQAYERGVPCVQGTVVGGKVVERSTGRRPFSIVRWKPSNNNKNHRPTQWPLLAQMIVKDLGMDEQTALEHLTTHTVFLYLGSVCGGSSSSSSNKSNPHHILGVVTIRPISQAYRMSSLHERSLTPSQAMLGIGILWTHPAARKTGVAATLVNCARRHAVFGMVVEKSMIAFSSPTQAGYDFAMRYLNDSDMKEVKQMAPLVYEM